MNNPPTRLDIFKISYLDYQSEKRNLSGYVLNDSAIKKEKKNYFNMELETESGIKSVVCFPPTKRRMFEDTANQHTGCEICNVKLNYDATTVFISDYSTVHPKKLGFERTNSYDHKFISVVINEISLNTRAVLNMRDIRHITVGNDEVAIRKGFLSDNTGHIKLTSWREYTMLLMGQHKIFTDW